MQHVKRDPALEAVELFRRLDASDDKALLSAPGRASEVVRQFAEALDSSLANASRVQGWRMQSLFRSLVVALDGCCLMTFIDKGEIFFEGDPVKAPDFFLHLRDGQRILVDVKSHRSRPAAQDPYLVKFSQSEIDALRRFGVLYGADVFLAVHFEGGNWTLLPLDALTLGPGGGYRIGVAEAMKASHLGLLGDRLIGTVPLLEIVVIPDMASANHVDNEGKAEFAVGSLEIRAGGKTLETPASQSLALFLLQFGDWEMSEHATVDDSRLVSMTWRAAPTERRNEREHFEFVGSLARMFSRRFEGLTATPEGPVALDAMPEPGAVKRLIPEDLTSSELPLWVFELEPVLEETNGGTA
ncbi:hypothetical protein [Microbacterium sp. NPDC056736]|uniref:hypothetical protein n=1 Tax=Microbacterium sp. NPDC056736 TaxID=3345932 RepID=UPI00366F43C8